MTANPPRPERPDDAVIIGPIRSSSASGRTGTSPVDLDDAMERASWQDWQRTFNDRILANLFRRTAEGS